MKRLLATMTTTAVSAALLVSCAAGGKPVLDDTEEGSAFRTLLANNPSDALEESGIELPAELDAACETVAAEHAALAGETYRVAVSGDSPPLAYKDELDPERLLGYHPAIAEATLACLGVDFEYVFFDFAGLAPAMEAGRADIQWRPIFASAERATIMDFAIYQQNYNDIMTRHDELENIKEFEDLCGKTVAVPAGGDVEKRFLDGEYDQFCEGVEKIGYLSFPNVAQEFQALENKKVDALLVSNAASVGFSEIAVTRFNDGTVNLAGPSVMKGNDDLLSGLLDALTAVQEAGVQQALLAAYDAPESLFREAEIFTAP